MGFASKVCPASGLVSEEESIMRRYWALAALCGVATVVTQAQQPPAQPPQNQPPVGVGFNERVVEKLASPEDRDANIYMLDFHFKDPRIVRVNVPKKGETNVWYLWYQVSNQTGEPRNFNPRFVWVAHDINQTFQDQVLHTAQNEIKKIEDEQNILNIKNSWTVSKEPVPLSKEFDDRGNRISYPVRVTGVATWADVPSNSTQFSILVYGLSNGFVKVDGPDGKEIVRVKTLRLDFRRVGDDDNIKANQVKFEGYKWIYATTDPLPMDPPKLGAAR
jgi:hypothetical protein